MPVGFDFFPQVVGAGYLDDLLRQIRVGYIHDNQPFGGSGKCILAATGGVAPNIGQCLAGKTHFGAVGNIQILGGKSKAQKQTAYQRGGNFFHNKPVFSAAR